VKQSRRGRTYGNLMSGMRVANTKLREGLAGAGAVR
jgi:hypothetical protein